MTPEEQTYLILKGVVYEQPEEARSKVLSCIAEIRGIIKRAGLLPGCLAIGMLGAEMAVDPSGFEQRVNDQE